MKKKLSVSLYALLILFLVAMLAFIVIKADGNKLELTIELVVYMAISAVVMLVCQKLLHLMIDQVENNGKKKMTVRQIFLFDAILVIVWVVLAVSKVVENYRGYDATGANIHRSANLTLFFWFAIITVLAIGYTIEVCHKAFKKKYRYEKRKLRVIINGREAILDGEVFEARNYKGEMTWVEVVVYLGEEKVCATGDDETEAIEKLGEILSGMSGRHPLQ